MLFSFDLKIQFRNVIVDKEKFLVEISNLKLETFELAEIILFMLKRLIKEIDLFSEFIQFTLIWFIDFGSVFKNLLKMLKFLL